MSGDQKSLSDSIEFGFASWTLRHSCPWTRHTDDVWGSEEPVRRHQHHHPRLRPQHHLHPHRSPLVLLSPKFCHGILWGRTTNITAKENKIFVSLIRLMLTSIIVIIFCCWVCLPCSQPLPAYSILLFLCFPSHPFNKGDVKSHFWWFFLLFRI